MGESTTPLTEVVTSHVVPSKEILPCPLTLILSSENSQNSEAQSVAKAVDRPSTEEIDVASRGVSSAILTSLRGDVQSNFLELDDRSQEQVPLNLEPGFDQTPTSINVETEEEEEEPPLRWNRTGVRGANTLTVGAPDLEIVDNPPKVDHIAETPKYDKERQRKEKGKLVVSHSKGDKRKYITRSETQKVLGSVIAASKAQTKRIKKRGREGHQPKYPTSTPLSIGSSAIESDDITAYVAKRRKEGEEEKVKPKKVKKTTKKSPTKREKVKKRTIVKSTRTKGPGPSIRNTGDNEEMSRDARIAEMEK
ncbi:hypothetical protein H5410_004416 [Solanum commersonii]|uniref:Uncharacterized protein n=1 Tax=Solanum commersonii TaxID=4109 RepID=A0A9J6B7X1_SOLCO|nr:hypothetical protein H5410_004416 [Solanum commersonii]